MFRHRFLLLTVVLLSAGILGVFANSNTGDTLFSRQEEAADRTRQYAELDRAAEVIRAHEEVLKAAVRLSQPFVVHIDARKRDNAATRRSGQEKFFEEAGSGILFEHRGRIHIVTNRHVIKGAAKERIVVHLDDGTELTPTRILSDPETDIAVLDIEAEGLVAARLGDSDKVEIGDSVLAVGSPFGLSRSVTSGIISAKGRRDLELGGDKVTFQDFLQTDAAINPGNSGGPLLNLRGEVIGMNTAIASSSGGNEGIGFSIPVNMAMFVARQLLDNGEVIRGFLGVSLDAKFNDATARQLGLPRRLGTRVTAVTPGAPADRAGLRIDDVILEYDGRKIDDDFHLINLVGMTEVDREVTLVVLRGRRMMEVKVRPVDRRTLPQSSRYEPLRREAEIASLDLEVWDFAGLGLSMAQVDDPLAQALHFSQRPQGLLVAEVDPKGPAAGRIQEGEIIDQVGDSPVRQPQDLERVLSQTPQGKPVTLRIVTQDRHGYFGVSRTVHLRPQADRF